MNPLLYPVKLYGEHFAWPKRKRVIAQAIVPFLANERTLLDVGCGDGKLAMELKKHCPAITIHGADNHTPPGGRCAISCSLFDGLRLPFADNVFDVCLIVDVLHHSRFPEHLLKEASRVARYAVIVKDHDYRNRLDFLVMQAGDYLGNHMFGVDLPYNFKQWEEFEMIFAQAGLSIEEHDDSLKPAGFLELHHHFLVKLVPQPLL